MTEDQLDAERLSRAALTRVGELGDAELGRLVARLGPVAVLEAIRDGTLPSRRLPGYQSRLPGLDPEADLAACERVGGRFLCPGDSEWPTQLDDLGERGPLGLWVRGGQNLRHLAVRSVTVVGARAATGYGIHVATDLGAGLGERAWTVVSGAAYGVDAAAHRGALSVGAPTIAVLACGVDVPYPSGHAALLDRIADDGLVVSAFPPGTRPARYRFIERNRLMAALTRGVVVVEAAYRSGALSTARAAAELGRYVMAVPGPVTSLMSGGVNLLLREPGVVAVTDAADVAEQVDQIGESLAPPRRGPVFARDSLDPVTARVLEAVPRRHPISVPAISHAAGVPADQVMRCLGLLRARGLIVAEGAGWRQQPGAGP
ncbi:DNA polymerase III subunit beta [Carbonactinospora thermoautotrophica]|uniref:DNA polymerase III subunit beta n=1 Tax=Carbonactinospora thermoautotrophica TaxID=1469144 RepID=A0A132N7K4_9ACTN|nr:DNA-processing protein DprA [Carbonactinospora thermoautotrophica]KWX06083.1 DNA polymerase III subunit beta [Carbonactinospora thermoautotrophica]KWX09604.1 DNA polymerase III subunit beta [Carbonactinospora thermoautotrophica]